MDSPLHFCSILARRHPRVIVIIWVCVTIAAVPLAARQSSNLTLGGYEVPHSQSAKAEAIIAKHFPSVSRTGLAVFLSPNKGATAHDLSATISAVGAALRNIPGLTLTAQAREQAEFGSGLVGPVVLQLQVRVGEARTRVLVSSVRERLAHAGTRQVGVYLVGESALTAAVANETKRELAHAEEIGFPLLLITLLLIFGSPVAAGLPLMLAAVTITVTGAAIYLLSHLVVLSTFTVDTAVMIGMAVAVDYSLIILVRLRQERHAGRDRHEARQIAFETSGRAVVYSGLSVMAALAAVWIVPINTLRSMAVGVILVVAISLVALVTLLPAVLTLVDGSGLPRWRLHRRSLPTPRRPQWASWTTWTRTVTAHPKVSIAIAITLLVPFCVPLIRIRTSTGALEQLGPANETRQAFDRAAKVDGNGFLAPITITLHAANQTSAHRVEAVASSLREITEPIPGITQVGPLRITPAKTDALFTAIIDANPESPAAEHLVQMLRRRYARQLSGTNLTLAVGGVSAGQLDVQTAIVSHQWLVLLVMGLTIFVILLLLMRSLLIPFKAIVMNLLSLAAALGVLTAIFQHGLLSGLFGHDAPGHVYTLVPPLLVGLVFGLSMDYEVFLLSRIRERWLASNAPERAIAEGLEASASAISGAALVLVCAFAVFVGVGIPTIKELGAGAAIAIAIDVTVVRLMLVPAAMTLLARWNWWLPGPLARLTPPTSPAPEAATIV